MPLNTNTIKTKIKIRYTFYKKIKKSQHILPF